MQARMSLLWASWDPWRRATTKTTRAFLDRTSQAMPPTSKAPAFWGRTCHSGTRVAHYRSTNQIRNVQIEASPSANVEIPASETSASSAATPGETVRALPRTLILIAGDQDATFDIVAASEPLLSVSLSPSQNLYTRRGTLVGVGGKADNVPCRTRNGFQGDYSYNLGCLYALNTRTFPTSRSPYPLPLPKNRLSDTHHSTDIR